jgi:hypothetical protein
MENEAKIVQIGADEKRRWIMFAPSQMAPKWGRRQRQWHRATNGDSVLFSVGIGLHNFNFIRDFAVHWTTWGLDSEIVQEDQKEINFI